LHRRDRPVDLALDRKVGPELVDRTVPHRIDVLPYLSLGPLALRLLRFGREPRGLDAIVDEQPLPFVHREHAPRVSLGDVVRWWRRWLFAIERGQARLERSLRSGEGLDVLKIELDDVRPTISIVPPELPFAPLLGIVQLRWGEPSREVVSDWAPGQVVWHALHLRKEDD